MQENIYSMERSGGDNRNTAREPARWKMWLVRWSMLYPTILLVNELIVATGLDLPAGLRLLVTTGCGSAALTFFLVPCATRALRPWLYK